MRSTAATLQILIATVAAIGFMFYAADMALEARYEAGRAVGEYEEWLEHRLEAEALSDLGKDTVLIVTCDCREQEARDAVEHGLDWSAESRSGDLRIAPDIGIATHPVFDPPDPGAECRHDLVVATLAYWTDGVDRNRTSCALCGEVLNELGEERGR